jgi:hypothetical protein
LNCQLALAWCLLRWSLPCGDQIQKLPSFSMTGATRCFWRPIIHRPIAIRVAVLKVRAGCSDRACPDLCGGCPVMGIPTAIQGHNQPSPSSGRSRGFTPESGLAAGATSLRGSSSLSCVWKFATRYRGIYSTRGPAAGREDAGQRAVARNSVSIGDPWRTHSLRAC